MQISKIAIAICCLAGAASARTAFAASLSKADQRFMIMAAKSDMTEAHEGQMAEQRARRNEIKTFAKTLVQDHTESYERLTELAAKTGVAIPKGIDTANNRAIEHLARVTGRRFDRQFVRDEIRAHRHAIALFKQEAKRGENAAVKAYAANMTPILEKHLHLVEECAKPAKGS